MLFFILLLALANACGCGGDGICSRDCPTCSDVMIAYKSTVNMALVGNMMMFGNITANNMSSINTVLDIVNSNIAFCQSVYTWPKMYDKGGVCMNGGEICKYGTQDNLYCLDEDCIICNDELVCEHVVNDSHTIKNIMIAEDFSSNTSNITNVYEWINENIDNCKKYNFANIPTYSVIILFTLFFVNSIVVY